MIFYTFGHLKRRFLNVQRCKIEKIKILYTKIVKNR